MKVANEAKQRTIIEGALYEVTGETMKVRFLLQESVGEGGHHDWEWTREEDWVVCMRCGMKMSVTEFRNVRDTKCEDWLAA